MSSFYANLKLDCKITQNSEENTRLLLLIDTTFYHFTTNSLLSIIYQQQFSPFGNLARFHLGTWTNFTWEVGLLQLIFQATDWNNKNIIVPSVREISYTSQYHHKRWRFHTGCVNFVSKLFQRICTFFN